MGRSRVFSDWVPHITDEWQAIALNYTSGTTGQPKGVVYHHRGAYLLAMGNVVDVAIPKSVRNHSLSVSARRTSTVLNCPQGVFLRPVSRSLKSPLRCRHFRYLWTLPMFHCNGWCFPWSVSIEAGVHICLRSVAAGPIYRELADRKATHLCGAPIVMQMLVNASKAETRPLPGPIEFLTAAAPPPVAVLAAMNEMGFKVTHVYGLTEIYGPAVINEWHADWDQLNAEQRAEKRSRQGVKYSVLEDLAVIDPATMEPTPPDGATIGEVMCKGNVSQ